MNETTLMNDKSSSLPTEVLVHLFHHAVLRDPRMISTLCFVCKDWFITVNTFKSQLWQTGTFSRFPAMLNQEYKIQDWRETFLINSNWSAGLAQTVILKAPSFTGIEGGVGSHDLPTSELQGDDYYTPLSHNVHYHIHHRLQDKYYELALNLEQSNRSQPIQEVEPVTKNPLNLAIDGQSILGSEEFEALCCGHLSYEDVCLIPQAKICVRTCRDPSVSLMRVYDWSLQISVEIDGINSHRDLISDVAVNEEGTLFVSSSIDGSIRVWKIQDTWCQGESQGGSTVMSFRENLENNGYPIEFHCLLLGHVGWVNAVDIKSTTIVSGGGDHTIRVWDGISGNLIRTIPDLYSSRQTNLGVNNVTISGSLIGSGSILEGYQIHDLETGQMVMNLDEPLCPYDHARFESEVYQFYSTIMVIADTVIITNSKLEGMLCVWDRYTGKFLYRIQVAPLHNSAINWTCYESIVSSNTKRLKTFVPKACGMHIYSTQDGNIAMIRSFKVNKSGSRLICALSDGSVSLMDFKIQSSGSIGPLNMVHDIQVSPELDNLRHPSQTAWIWSQDSHDSNRIKRV